ncbi:Ca2+-binding RTX toxin-like protein [Sphingobium fontiphilum]|uniref:Ca2+-binding RTX toxin-like protein n=1 Tax=Sphingobium fontiphilum TaxID=944425 RepID=A0A7W6DD43_9SPHN|nr:Calx-beta domain-containing protein [Sphingobium fontiphilum]MBB3981051.1 Ca2+-binding RTX toxin-like protein [Sphingobium fontiphilum]
MAVSVSNIFVDDVVVDESRTYVDIQIRLDQANLTDATISYSTYDGSADYRDYDSQSGSITFAAGETVKTVRILLHPDSTAEGDEVFFLNIFSPSSNLTIADAFAEVRIGANDASSGTPNVSVADVVIDEAQGTATFIVSLDRPSTGTVSMNYATQNGTAIAGSDFTAAAGSLVFAAGETVKTVTVAITNDMLAEGNESFSLALSNLSGATSLVPTATGTIWANDAPAVVNSLVFVENAVVDETRSYVDVTVRLDRPNSAVATINYSTTDGSADYRDYDSQSGTLTFAAGETVKTVRILLNRDGSAEGDENFYLNIFSPSSNLTVADAFAEVRIGANDAPAGMPNVSVADVVIDEAQGTATFIVSLDRPSTGTVSMNYATQNGTAIAGSDFTAAAGSLVFAAGETVKTVTVAITNDMLAEGNESFSLALSNLSGATSLVPTATGTIWANDAPAVVNSFVFVENAVVDETRTYVDVTVRLDRPNSAVATINYSTDDGSADYRDYDSQSGSITFAAGETVKTVRIALSPDSSAEGDENFYLGIFSPSSNLTIADGSAEVRIGANDAASGTPNASVADVMIDEAQGTATFIVSLDRPSTGTVSMHYATQNGTATAGSDFTAASGSLVFAAGETVKTVTVAIANDMLAEGNESFSLALSSLAGANSLVPTATGTIWANDAPAVVNSLVFVENAVVDETRTYVDVTVRLDRPNSAVATINYSTTDGSADYRDYDSQSGSITFAAGETVKTVRIVLSPDAYTEGDENFYVNIFSPSSNLTIADAFAEVRIGANDAASGTPIVSVADVVIDEAQGTATFIVSLDRPSTGTVSMNYATQNGTAVAGSDFSAASGSLVFAAGETVKTVTVAITNDLLTEGNESFSLALSSLIGVTSLVPTATGTIWANDAPAVSNSFISVENAVVDETRTYVDVTVRLDRPNSAVATINYSTDDGSADYRDYDSQSGTLTFAAGETVKTVRIALSPDSGAEGDENFYLGIFSPSSNLTIADGSAEVRIGANDAASGTPNASVADVMIDEAQGTATFIVSLDRPSTGTVSMHYATQNGTATAGSDFTAVAGSLVFAAGETVKTVTVAITNDMLAEGNESFSLALSNLSGATANDARGIGIVGANDAPLVTTPVVRVSPSSAAEDSTYIDFVVQLDAPSAAVVSVRYDAQSDTADYRDLTLESGELVFLPGETLKTVRITIEKDSYSEGTETFSLVLYSPSNATIDPNAPSARGFIGDEENPQPITMNGGGSSDILRGWSQNDTLNGNEGDDFLDGGRGLDGMTGGLGNDTYIVDEVGDNVFEVAGQGIDTVVASVDFALGAQHIENLILVGAGDIDATGNGLANNIVGNDAANVINGGGAADRMAGGRGDDIYYVDNVGDIVIEAAGEGYDIVRSSVSFSLAGQHIERLILTGTAHIDGTGNGLNNDITGNNGNNVINGGAGLDTMSGGLGDDSYYVDNAGDVIIEAAGEGTDTVFSSLSFSMGAQHIENLVLTGAAAINGTGNALNNAITGNGAANIINGGSGADRMAGGNGGDIYYVDNAGDVVTEAAGQGDDLVNTTVSFTLGNDVERLILAGAAAINGSGNGLNNNITGNSAANIINGGSGADQMAGGGGDDTYYVDNVGDSVIELAGGGADTVRSAITYTMGDNLENLLLSGAASINGIGNALDNQMTGNGGNNAINGGLGADRMAGGAGDDIYYVDNVGDTVIETANQGADTVRSTVSFALGSQHIENLVLTGAASINGTGNGLANNITGNSAANRLDGGGGADRMAGGAGDDIYVVDNISDVVIETAGNGVDTVQSSVNHSLAGEVENLILIGSASINGIGNTLANQITGNSGDNAINGGLGADRMAGGLGNDSYYVDNVGDVVLESSGQGADTVRSSISFALGAQYIENLVLVGNGAIDGAGNSLANSITGNAAANVINGGGGADRMAGGDGDDVYFVDNAGDVVTETVNQGNDTVRSSVSFALGAQHIETLILTGNGAVDGIGNSLANIITGNGAANLIDGGARNDILTGGGGADSFRFSSALGAGNVDVIADFQSGQDRILLAQSVFSQLGSGALAATAFVVGAQAGDADDRIIYDSATGNLLYDADGTGAGAAVLFATLSSLPPLSASDFLVI